jgi:hypothetical protein
MQVLLGVDKEAKGADGATALHWAVWAAYYGRTWM